MSGVHFSSSWLSFLVLTIRQSFTVKDSRKSIDSFIRSSLGDLKRIPHSQFIKSQPTSDQIVHYARTRDETMLLLLLGSTKKCTPAFMNELARKYSLPTPPPEEQFNNNDQFKRYRDWLYIRNSMIKGFTEDDGNYYLVADREFHAGYGFCTACGMLRCSPVWCICGHKELSNGWTSGDNQLDDFIKKSQMQTKSANEAYLEWIPFSFIRFGQYGVYLNGLPTRSYVKLIPFEMGDLDKLHETHSDLLSADMWISIGFTYDANRGQYYLIKEKDGEKLCLACTQRLLFKVDAFCFDCKRPRPLDWTTGNKSLDSFITKSWDAMTNHTDSYIRWIEYSQLRNVREMASLHHGCTHSADWSEPVNNKLRSVTLKKVVDGQIGQDFDFYQLLEDYPKILTPDNIWIIGVTQQPTTKDYFLVFYPDVRMILDEILQENWAVNHIPYDKFENIEKIDSGGCGTIHRARLGGGFVVLKEFKRFGETSELFISEFRNNIKCWEGYPFLRIYGITQDPETTEYMIVMQYAKDGDLVSYLGQNIAKLTWRTKLQYLKNIAHSLSIIHLMGLVHCDLHGGNIVVDGDRTFICDLGLSQSVAFESPSTIRGVLPFIAPEVFDTRKHSQKADIFAFGIIMYLMATGEPPFRDREFDKDLVCDIMGGLRPPMPDSAPEEYKKLAGRCCHENPNTRPDVWALLEDIGNLVRMIETDTVWDTIYYNNVKPLSSFEKKSRYTSKILFAPGHGFGSVPGKKGD